MATVVLLDVNASPVRLSDDEAFRLVMDVAAGESRLDRIADRLMRR